MEILLVEKPHPQSIASRSLIQSLIDDKQPRPLRRDGGCDAKPPLYQGSTADYAIASPPCENKTNKRGNPMPLLSNHIAVVTGAASGIGRAIASGYASEGAQVALLDMNGKAAEEAAQEIRD